MAGVDMVYVVQLEPSTSVSAAMAAVARAPAEELALAFPFGAACALAREEQLAALQTHCEALGKQVAIIGGDEMLRAQAVAAGFGAATSVDEWETSRHRAVRLVNKLLAPVKRAPGDLAPGAADLRVVAEPDPIDDASDLYDFVGEDPPRYVAELVSAGDSDATPRHDDVPTIPLQWARTTRRLRERLRDAADAAALERAHQAYEEQLTDAIRATGGLAESDSEARGADGSEGPSTDTDARSQG